MLLHLFDDPGADTRDAQRHRRQAQARTQPRCLACGRFAGPLRYETVCDRCLLDKRPAIVLKVEEARRWWKEVRCA
jgi:hypothetical protein